MNIQKVLVAGCGTMGSQIAMQAARYGYSVQVYDLSQQAREKRNSTHTAGLTDRFPKAA